MTRFESRRETVVLIALFAFLLLVPAGLAVVDKYPRPGLVIGIFAGVSLGIVTTLTALAPRTDTGEGQSRCG